MIKLLTVIAVCVLAFLSALKLEPTPKAQAEEIAALVSHLFERVNGRTPRDSEELALALANPQYAFGLCLRIDGGLQPINRYDIALSREDDGRWRVLSVNLKAIYEAKNK